MNNAFLRSITARDLNQRYCNTYILYKDKPILCQQIVEGDNGDPFISYIPIFDREITRKDAIQDILDVREISIDRPKAGFYTTTSGTSFYFSYRPRKIYSRGLLPYNAVIRDGNCQFHYIGFDTREVSQTMTMMSIRAVLLNIRTSYKEINFQSLVQRVCKDKTSIIMRHHFCASPDIRNPSYSALLYRAKRIGEIDNETKKITVFNTKLIPELLEVIKGIDQKDLIHE